jgi:hypothetical protein
MTSELLSVLFSLFDLHNNKSFTIVESIPVSILFVVLGLYSIRMILWFIQGKEIVSIVNEELIICKKGSFLITKEKRIPLDSIKKIEYYEGFYEQQNRYEMGRFISRQAYIFKIQNTGRLKLHLVDSKTYRFLDNINEEQATEIIKKIKT